MKRIALSLIAVTAFTIAALGQNLGTSQTLSTRIAALETNVSTYGGIFENSAAGNTITMTTLGVFYPWIGSTVAYTNKINSGGTNLVTTASGYYQIWAEASGFVNGAANTNHIIMGAIYTNDVRCVPFNGRGTAGNTNSVASLLAVSFAVTGPPVYLPSSCRVDLRIANTNINLTTDYFTNNQTHLSMRRLY